jgi:serine/threonine protein kinase
MKKHDKYTNIVDWWSVGILAYEILTGRTPFAVENDDGDNRLYDRLLHKTVKMPKKFFAGSGGLNHRVTGQRPTTTFRRWARWCTGYKEASIRY